MRRLASALAIAGLLLAMSSPASAAPATRGFLPPDAHARGHSLVDLATAWNSWILAAPAESNPFVAARCEPSPVDPMIWFLPEAYPGGPTASTCTVPQGAMLVVSPFFMECSAAEPDPFHGSNEAELRACVAADFSLLSSIAVTLDGRPATRLGGYVVTTRLATVPADNLLGPDPTITMNRGYFMVIAPLSRGTHALGATWSVDAMEVAASLDLTIVVR